MKRGKVDFVFDPSTMTPKGSGLSAESQPALKITSENNSLLLHSDVSSRAQSSVSSHHIDSNAVDQDQDEETKQLHNDTRERDTESRDVSLGDIYVYQLSIQWNSKLLINQN